MKKNAIVQQTFDVMDYGGVLASHEYFVVTLVT